MSEPHKFNVRGTISFRINDIIEEKKEDVNKRFGDDFLCAELDAAKEQGNFKMIFEVSDLGPADEDEG